jgi:hypothetical protein
LRRIGNDAAVETNLLRRSQDWPSYL